MRDLFKDYLYLVYMPYVPHNYVIQSSVEAILVFCLIGPSIHLEPHLLPSFIFNHQYSMDGNVAQIFENGTMLDCVSNLCSYSDLLLEELL